MSSALKILAYTTIPTTYQEASYWITRTLAHFPRRDAAKDGVIIADLAGALVERKLSLCAVAAVLESVWQNATEEKPWFPVTGQILRDIGAKSASYASAITRLINQQTALPAPTGEERSQPFGGRKWPEFSDDDKEEFRKMFLKSSPTVRSALSRILQVPEGTVFECDDPAQVRGQSVDEEV